MVFAGPQIGIHSQFIQLYPDRPFWIEQSIFAEQVTVLYMCPVLVILFEPLRCRFI